MKLVLDFFLLFTVLRLLFKNRYDAIHTHEEACCFGAVLSRLWRIPHVYDMHSSLAQQFINFNVTKSQRIRKSCSFFEKRALKASDAIIAICPYRDDHVKSSGVNRRVFVIENTPEADMFFSAPDPSRPPLREDERFKGRKRIPMGPPFSARRTAKQEFRDLQPTSDGGFVLLTTALSSRGTPIRISIVKLDSIGNVDWRKVSVVKELDTPRNILQTADGGYIVTSSSGWIIKLDSSGSVGSMCRNILTAAQTIVKDIRLTVERRSPTVVVTHATPVVEPLVSAPVTPIVEPFCAP